MSNSAELNQAGPNPIGQFGFTPVYATERPEYDFQRGGAPTTARPIVASEWDVNGTEYMLLVSYDPTTRLRSERIMVWRQPALRWDTVPQPPWSAHLIHRVAESLFFPESLPLESS